MHNKFKINSFCFLDPTFLRDNSVDFTHTDQPQRYDQAQFNDELEKPITRRFLSTFPGET